MTRRCLGTLAAIFSLLGGAPYAAEFTPEQIEEHAQRMGLYDRGLIRERMYADIIIFNYEDVDDVASWDEPTASPIGIESVTVNGKFTLDKTGHTGAPAGRVLRHSCN